MPGTHGSDADDVGGEASLFLEEEPTGHGRRGRQTLLVALACTLGAAAIGIPVALVLTSGGASNPKVSAPPVHRDVGNAKAQVISALSATTDSGSFNMTYEFSTPSTTTSPSTTSTTACPGPISSPPSAMGTSSAVTPIVAVCNEPAANGNGGETITGQGTIDTDPYAMVATSQVPGLGTVTLRANDMNVWELGGADYGLSPGSQSSGAGSPLSGFAGLVEGTLGQREGASAMLSLASPTGYLNLEQQEVTGANFIGTGTVDGVAVDQYQVFTDPALEATLPNLTTEQVNTIDAALKVLAQNGYKGTSTVISIDASGFIRRTASVAEYADGSTSRSESTLSDFACAGTVLMPGQQGAATPPAGCVSPDTGVAPATATTTTETPSTLPAIVVPTTKPPTTSTTTPPSTTSTTTNSSTTSTGPTTTTTTEDSTPTS
ncbi:MAG TPA: hypothetical protein VGG09_14570 [Acidimicrobiales bacterium]|jgi:hypothetical protein